MKYYKCDAKTAEENIKDMFPPVQATSLPLDILERLSTDKVTVIAAYLGDQAGSGVFGQLIGYAKLQKPIVLEQEDFYDKGEQIHVETEYVRFFYTVYRPGRDSDYMSTIQPYYDYLCDIEDREKNRKNNRIRIQLEQHPWGAMGFWEETPTEDLSGDDLYCRLFIENVTKVSKEEEWAKMLKKRFEMHTDSLFQKQFKEK
jgi:hypothetical protein